MRQIFSMRAADEAPTTEVPVMDQALTTEVPVALEPSTVGEIPMPVPAERTPGPVAEPPPAPPKPSAADGELIAQRDRLQERFAIMQCELGGLFYEMAIRDHVRMDVLIERAAALQRLDAELGQIERMLEAGHSAAGGTCPSCGSIYARGAAFCAQCAHPLAGA
jgi:hypothetical protein